MAGPWGGMVGNVAGHYAGDKVNASLRDGIIGDALGTRTFEGYRDSLEEMGLVEREIAEAVNEMSREQERGRHQAAQNPSSRSTPDRDKFGLGYSFGGNVTDSQGNHASVGVTEGSPFGGASVSNPGSTESGMLGDMAAGMFGGGSESSGGVGGGNAGGVRGGGSEGNSGYW